MSKLDDGAKALINRPIDSWATVVRPDGSLHSTVVWVDLDGDDVLINTAVGRVKEQYLRSDPRISVSVLDPDNKYHYVSVSGTARLELEGAEAHIDRLAKKYLDADSYPFRKADEQRITVRITPDHVIYSNA